jgi:hypothetical protein
MCRNKLDFSNYLLTFIKGELDSGNCYDLFGNNSYDFVLDH